MKKSIAGAVLSICGTILFSAILISGAVFSSTMDAWSGSSKFWNAILGKSVPNEGMTSMELSFLFYLSIALFFIGIVSLLWEQLKKMLEMKI